MRKVVVYVHEETNKIVSKVCRGCGEIKLTDDYPKTKAKILDFPSLCKDCPEMGGNE